MTGKKWLERPKTKPPLPENLASPIVENFPKSLPKIPEPTIIKEKPLITAEKPTNQDNSLLTTETEPKLAIISYYSKPLIRQISPKNQAEFFLDDRKQLPIQPTEKEQILLAKIKHLEEQLKQTKEENNHLKAENKHLKALIRKDQETEAKVIQPLPFKPNK